MTSLLPNAEVEVPIACHPPVGEPPAQGNTPRAASPERRTGTAVHGPSDPLAVAATMSGAAAELQAAIQGREALCATPWSLTIVEHRHDAEFLREHLDIEAVGLDEASWKSKLPPSGDVLLIGRTQRVAGDLPRLGVRQCFAGHVPVPYMYVSEFLEERAKASNYTVGKADLRELWKVVTDTAQAVDAAPTGHPDLQPTPPTLEVFSLLDLASQPRRRHVVPGLIVEDSLNVLVGPPKHFKTVTGDSLCVALADGGTFLGRQVTSAGLVMDCALEGVAGKVDRYRAHIGLARFANPDDPIHRRLFLMRSIPNLATSAGQDMLLRTIDQLTRRTKMPLTFLKVDTLGRAMSIAGLDENKTSEMGAFVAGLDRIRDKFPCPQLVVHHTGKNGVERGSTALTGAADLLMFCTKTGKFEAKLVVRDARDVEVPAPWFITFAPVVVGEQEDGSLLTALRIDTARQAALPRANGDGRPGASNENTVARLLDVAGPEGLTRSQVARESGLVPTTVLEVVERLIAKGIAFAQREGKRWRYIHASCRATVGQLSAAVEPTVPTSPMVEVTTVALSGPLEEGRHPDSWSPTVGGEGKHPTIGGGS